MAYDEFETIESKEREIMNGADLLDIISSWLKDELIIDFDMEKKQEKIIVSFSTFNPLTGEGIEQAIEIVAC